MRIAAIAALVLVAACAKNDGNKRKRFESAADFKRAQQEAGFVLLGSFGDCQWPAAVELERTQAGSISFTTEKGASHGYPGYAGYTMKYVRLKGRDGRPAHFVLRSEKKP